MLVVWKLDRLARSLHDLVVIAEDLKGRSVGLKILTGEGAAVDTTHPQGRMVFGILAVMAEFERELISERTVAGMVAAKRRGRHVGQAAEARAGSTRHGGAILAGEGTAGGRQGARRRFLDAAAGAEAAVKAEGGKWVGSGEQRLHARLLGLLPMPKKGRGGSVRCW